MAGTTKGTAALGAACVTIWLLVSLAAVPVYGHGIEGQRIVNLFDLSAAQLWPEDLMTISNAYQMQLLTYGGSTQNDCLRLQAGPVRFSWDKEPALPPPPVEYYTIGDYIVWGGLSEGDPSVVDLYLSTYSRQTLSHGRCQVLENPVNAAAVAAVDLIEGDDGFTTSLLEIIYSYERRTREKDGFPEFGYWYGLMTLESYLDVRYDVKIYQPIKIDADQWRAIKQGAAPYRDEETAGEPIRRYSN
jgi:hypothetical protein